MKKIRLHVCNDDVYKVYDVQLYNDKGIVTTVRKRNLILRSMEQVLKIQFSLTRKFNKARTAQLQYI
jgi:hypothetical protein